MINLEASIKMAKKNLELLKKFLKLENLIFLLLFQIMNFATLQVHNLHMIFD